MEKGWIKIATYTNELTGELARLSLEKEDIAVVLLNKQDSSLKFGKIELYVQEENEEKAQIVLNDSIENDEN